MNEGEGEVARMSKKLLKKIMMENYCNSRRIPVPAYSCSSSSSSSSSSDDDEAGLQEWIKISKAMKDSSTSTESDSDDVADASTSANKHSSHQFGGSSGPNEDEEIQPGPSDDYVTGMQETFRQHCKARKDSFSSDSNNDDDVEASTSANKDSSHGSSGPNEAGQSKHQESVSSLISDPVQDEEIQPGPSLIFAAPSGHASNQPVTTSTILDPFVQAAVESKPSTNVAGPSRCLSKLSSSVLGATRQETHQLSFAIRSGTSSSSINLQQTSYCCSILKCQKEYATQAALVMHKQAHYDMTRKFLCNICSIRCTSLRGFKSHFSKEHKSIPHMMHRSYQKSSSNGPARVKQGFSCKSPKRYSCSVSQCRKALNSLGGIKKHLRAHFDLTRKHKCIVCVCRFVSMRSLRCHFTKDHKGSTRIPRCQICRKAFENNEQLDEHLPYHMGQHKRSRTSTNCNVGLTNFRKRSGLREHPKSKYNSGKASVEAIGDVVGSPLINPEQDSEL